MSRKRLRQAKLMTAATRRAFCILAISATVVVVLVAMVLSVPPQISSHQLAADVKAMRVHKVMGLSAQRTEPSSTTGSAPSTYVHNAAEVQANHTASTTISNAPYPFVTFETLSGFRFFVTEQVLAKPSDSVVASWNCLGQIPQEVRTLSDKNVSLRGFMLPMRYEGKLTTEFLLLRNQSLCCYGKPPQITEWVNVRMVGKGVKPIMDEPVTVCGVFHVGDVRENGELVGIYGLDAEKVKGPRE